MKNTARLKKLETGGYKKICSVSELEDKKGKRFLINDIDIAVFKISSDVFVLSNICPHQQSALIYDGFIEDGCVVCPAHGWKFNLQNGRKESGSRGLETYPVIVFEDEVFAKVTPKKLRW